MKKTKPETSNHIDILSSIWILACNDENPQLTYEGIRNRLGLDSNINIKLLIQKRGELFRKQTPISHLNNWKEEMHRGIRVPTWVREIENLDERNKIIDSLTTNDIFRSQFRPDYDSPRSDIGIINWGLEHIERLRKVELDLKQEQTRKFTSIWLPSLSTLVAIIAVLSSFYVQIISNKDQVDLKHYEVELMPKQEGYRIFMSSIFDAYYSTDEYFSAPMLEYLNKMENSYYIFEPFLTDEYRDSLWNNFQEFSVFCLSTHRRKSSNTPNSQDSFFLYKTYFKSTLYKELFQQ